MGGLVSVCHRELRSKASGCRRCSYPAGHFPPIVGMSDFESAGRCEQDADDHAGIARDAWTRQLAFAPPNLPSVVHAHAFSFCLRLSSHRWPDARGLTDPTYGIFRLLLFAIVATRRTRGVESRRP